MLVYTKDTKKVGFAKDGRVHLIGSNEETIEETIELDPTLYGDHMDEKVCNLCNTIKPVDQFQINQNAKGDRKVRRPSCNDCRKEIDGIGMDPKHHKTWNKYKPHLEPFECPVCLKTTIPGLTSKVVLHHNHETGKIIGWICDSCNTGLGRFKDDIEVLKHAAWYLKTWS